MRRISWFGGALAGFAFALAPVALAQTSDRDPNVPADRVERPDSAPSAAQNDPDRGAHDPARIGTSTGSNRDLNNHRYVTSRPDVIVSQTDAVVPPPAPAPPAETVQATPEPPAQLPPAYEAPPASMPPVLPRTASQMPLAALAGLSALGAALVLRSRRR